MDNGGIWPGDEYYFESLKEKSYEERIKELKKELAEAHAEIGKLAKLIESMKNCQNCGRGIGFCRHCKYAPGKRGWDDNWKEPI